MATSAREQRENLAALSDPFARRALFVACPMRRSVVLYVCALLGMGALALFPTYSGGRSGATQAAASGQGIYGGQNNAGGAGAVPGGAPSAPGAVAPGTATGGATQGGAVAGPSGGGVPGGASTTVSIGSGVTRGGF